MKFRSQSTVMRNKWGQNVKPESSALCQGRWSRGLQGISRSFSLTLFSIIRALSPEQGLTFLALPIRLQLSGTWTVLLRQC